MPTKNLNRQHNGVSNGHVSTEQWRHCDPKGQGRALNTSRTRPWPFRVTWHHRACDFKRSIWRPRCFRTQYLKNGERSGLCSKRTVNRKWHMTKSNGHVIDDVVWSWNVKVVTPIGLGPIIPKTAVGTRLYGDGAPIGNYTWSIKWSRARWRHVTLKEQSRWCTFQDPAAIPACDRQTDRHVAVAKTVLCIASRWKK